MRARRAAAGAALLAALLVGPAALAQESPLPTVTGSVTGELTQGGKLSFRVDSTAVGGWQNLHKVDASVISGGQTIEELVFDIEDNGLTVGSQPIVVGTGAVATGDYLRVNGADVVLTTGGANLSFSVRADVIRPIPAAARFRLSVVDDFDRTATVTRRLAAPPEKGLTLGTVLTAVAVALLTGGFIGNLFASRRKPPPRLSVYGTMQRRIEEGRRPAAKGGA